MHYSFLVPTLACKLPWDFLSARIVIIIDCKLSFSTTAGPQSGLDITLALISPDIISLWSISHFDICYLQKFKSLEITDSPKDLFLPCKRQYEEEEEHKDGSSSLLTGMHLKEKKIEVQSVCCCSSEKNSLWEEKRGMQGSKRMHLCLEEIIDGGYNEGEGCHEQGSVYFTILW